MGLRVSSGIWYQGLGVLAQFLGSHPDGLTPTIFVGSMRIGNSIPLLCLHHSPVGGSRVEVNLHPED